MPYLNEDGIKVHVVQRDKLPKKTKKYIRDKLFKLKLYFAKIRSEYDLASLAKDVLRTGFNILITGLVISYIVNERNFLSYGLASAVVFYYLREFKQIFWPEKKNHKEEDMYS